MPTYEFLCLQCNQEFTQVMSISEFEKGKVTCPHCHSENVKQQMSVFNPKTSRKS